MGSLALFNEDSFEDEVLKSEVPVLVDFWAEWCGPCKVIAPIIEQISIEYEGRLKVGKLNVDESPQVASKFGIRGIPTLLLFRQGKPVEQIIGAVPKAQIVAKLNSHL
jgi:thioredoxin 1